MYIKTLTVSEVSNYIKKIIDSDFILNNTLIKGEISNFKIHSSGHAYFSLKDDYGKISCIMFKDKTRKLEFMPEDGMDVVVKGKVSVYAKDGVYQIYCEEIKLEGIGELSEAFNKLKKKLEAEGLFSVSHKKTIPKFCEKMGVITSPTGAAVRDIINVTKRRNKRIDIMIYPALVQGINAPEDIIRGINYFNEVEDIDVILLARGGGSIEELWSFNDEKLAYAIFNSKKPIISAVGHETDFTIADFVSDLRAPTPSAGAEIIAYDLEEANDKIKNYRYTIEKHIKIYIENKLKTIDMYRNTLEHNSPMAIIANSYSYIDRMNEILNKNVKNKLEIEKQKLSKLNALLSAHNPLNVLDRGYAIIENENSELISDINILNNTDKVKITLKNGNAKFHIEKLKDK
ncbi:exodeoxyribonuclease 7 large subunit [Clostridium pasteurianum DSM 525 = ATCC 6013]|uniref:Exodeoxyribonuclease 7 large subunit n=1 Tax=Clostridium pasteurianum DSM 525 = ATCC 6013 TaxID=1262449 RepID=A0A0H3J7U3_CLOPA|nr:exodeoxyribonuclease VII large subunit [Clostridium pasteurianum]AJA47978.1 exodeoxyribonuclease 7 large subunit [Clostridium pasteurianum DSM 525 = ATCC 6013]AJA51966.1 exodeoxyribonuclease 7 large subunit [Clostridium pasteurianum DSM 525 = ATCC 6013]AOZ75263.1 exodeoxyribonuclease VII large subunit [Clostridium pasteurianum DSM 525 = ATCC 6013]AOZ79058.1 exodeoxyribonuclease VII large subunit [Clostridium pasteurianum]ELP59881.1 exodeoxyribonuclease VII large subunit [Clostridium pasteur